MLHKNGLRKIIVIWLSTLGGDLFTDESIEGEWRTYKIRGTDGQKSCT